MHGRKGAADPGKGEGVMNVSILKRLAVIESKVQKPEEVPSLIMIGYDEPRKQWSIAETYSSGKGRKQAFKRKSRYADRLQQYSFPAEGNPRIILDTFGSLDPAIYENLFCFDLQDLRQDLKPGDTGEIRIEAIRAAADGSTTCEIVVFTR